MEKRDEAVSSFAGLGEGFSDMQNLNSSQRAINRDIESPTEQMGHFSIHSAPAVPHLVNSSTLSREVNVKAKSKDLNFDLKFKCPVCSVGFERVKAMYGHMRIHTKNDSNSSNRRSIAKPKPKHKPRPVTFPSIDHPFNLTWSVTKKRCWKPVKARYTREVVDASTILMDLSKSTPTGDRQVETTLWTPLVDLANEACNLSSPPNQTQERPPSRCKIVIRGPTQKKNGERPHVCEICGWSYKTGQELGGHKRRHYNGKQKDQ